jgi:hypothetical protein
MINFVEVFFCEKVILDPDGSPREIINRISSLKSEVYPYRFECTVVMNYTHEEPLDHLLTVSIKDSDGAGIFESAPQFLRSSSPAHPHRVSAVMTSLQGVKIPKPGRYVVEILLNHNVKHKEHLYFT